MANRPRRPIEDWPGYERPALLPIVGFRDQEQRTPGRHDGH